MSSFFLDMTMDPGLFRDGLIVSLIYTRGRSVVVTCDEIRCLESLRLAIGLRLRIVPRARR